MQDWAACSEEFEVLLRRAARRGVLDIDDLLESFRGSQTRLARPEDARRVDFEALTRLMCELPPQLFEIERILLVPSLDDFTYEEERRWGTLRAGVGAEGHVLVEAQRGLSSLIELAMQLCTWRHEATKAAALLSPDLVAQWQAMVQRGEGQEEQRAGEEEPLEQEVHPQGWEGLLSRLAFAWGSDALTLVRAWEDTEGRLPAALLSSAVVAPVFIHADLDPSFLVRCAHRQGEQIVSVLAEMGLLGRPLHLWVGSSVLTECLSPYTRELREVLIRWAQLAPGCCGTDLRSSVAWGEDRLYAIAQDFQRTHGGLREEHREADRTVGINRCVAQGGLNFDVVDLARVDSSLCDARLPPGTGVSNGVLLRLDGVDEGLHAQVLRTVLPLLGSSLAGITLVFRGFFPGAPPGSLRLPTRLIRWAGGHSLLLPFKPALARVDLQAYADAPVSEGTLVSVPSMALKGLLLDQERVRSVVQGVVADGYEHCSAIAEALWGGDCDAELPVTCAVIQGERIEGRRLAVDALSGVSSLAVATLRAFSERFVAQKPKPQSQSRIPGPQAMRIKV